MVEVREGHLSLLDGDQRDFNEQSGRQKALQVLGRKSVVSGVSASKPVTTPVNPAEMPKSGLTATEGQTSRLL